MRAELGADEGASPAALYDAQDFASTSTTDPDELTSRTGPTLATAVRDTLDCLPPAELSAGVDLLADGKRRIHLLGGRFTGLIAHYTIAGTNPRRRSSRDGCAIEGAR